jgi:hypothetical protein
MNSIDIAEDCLRLERELAKTRRQFRELRASGEADVDRFARERESELAQRAVGLEMELGQLAKHQMDGPETRVGAFTGPPASGRRRCRRDLRPTSRPLRPAPILIGAHHDAEGLPRPPVIRESGLVRRRGAEPLAHVGGLLWREASPHPRCGGAPRRFLCGGRSSIRGSHAG